MFQNKQKEAPDQKWVVTFDTPTSYNSMLLEQNSFGEIGILKCQWLMEATFTLIDDSFQGKLNGHDILGQLDQA